jgi:uncharacterized membrane protein
MTDWLEHTVQIEVSNPVEQVWSLWSDLEKMPKWMKWIEGVKIKPDNPEISDWILGSSGFNFTWQARILKQIPKQIIQWESVSGLPNRGAVRFYDRKVGTVVKLSIAYAIPGIVGQVMDDLFLGRVVESTLQADLERFKQYAEHNVDCAN